MAACQEEGIKLESDLAASVTQAMVGILIGIGEHDRRLIQYRDPKQLTIQHHELGAWKNRSPVSALVRQRMAAAFDQAYHHRTTH
ncbi:MAG TPA: hypothetical protein VMR75_02105 [Candidatus Saccharimonadales bacterium]|nr:hypothetical protein [Candidatus Saccharimonadales bacterium]